MTTERRVEETGTASFPASGSSPYTLPPLAYGYADLDPVRSALRIVLEHGGYSMVSSCIQVAPSS